MKFNGIAAAMLAAGMMVSGQVLAQTAPNDPDDGTQSDEIDNTECGGYAFEGLGEETCTMPNPTPGEGVMFTAAEQVVSIVSSIADSYGCAVLSGGPISVTIRPNANLAFPQSATTTIGAAEFVTTEVANSFHFDTGSAGDNGVSVRKHETVLDANTGVRGHIVTSGPFSSVFVRGLWELAGEFYADGPYSIVFGSADFNFNFDELDERVIKDFYQGVPVAAEVVGTNALLDNRIIRDNGLEVTTKKFDVVNLANPSVDLLDVPHPRGKWRQTSFYRGADGIAGQLTYTKVRIAPFGALECVVQLSGSVTQTISNPRFSGSVNVFPLTSDPASPGGL